MFIIYFLVGVFTGLLAMLFGFGGGFVVVPILFWLLPWHGVAVELAMHIAVGTSLMLMLINMVYTTTLHFRSQNLDMPLLKQMLPLLILGAIIGASTASMIDSQWLRYIFMTLIGLVLLRTIKQEFFKKDPSVARKPSKTTLRIVSLITGTIASLLGIGGSVIIVPFFRYYRIPMNKVSGLANALAIPSGVVGSIIFALAGSQETHLPPYSTGYIYWPAVLGIFIGSTLGVRVGGYLSKIMPDILYGKIYALLLLLVFISMALH